MVRLMTVTIRKMLLGLKAKVPKLHRMQCKDRRLST